MLDWLVLLFDTLGGITVIACTAMSHLVKVPPRFNLSFAVARISTVFVSFGLFGQAFRQWVLISTGIAPRDDELVMWLGKDIGLNIIAFSMALAILAQIREDRK